MYPIRLRVHQRLRISCRTVLVGKPWAGSRGTISISICFESSCFGSSQAAGSRAYSSSAGARLAARQLNLRGAFPLAAFAAGLSVLYGLATVGLTQFFTAAVLPSWGWFDLLPHAIVNALAAPVVSAAVGRLLGWFGDDDEARPLLSLESERHLS